MAGRQRLVVGVAAVIVVASLWRWVSVEQQKRRIAAAYRQAQETLAQLEVERAHLDQELTQARGTIEHQASDLGGLQTALQALESRLQQTESDLAALQREHEQLRQHDRSLNAQLGSVMAEKQQLEAKLSSITALKLAIRDVRQQMWNERLAAWREHVEAVKRADQARLASGNRGYVIRKGASTLGAGTKLQVRVLQPESR